MCIRDSYHSLDLSERANRILRKIDHMMIFVLIAGTYTPICLIVLQGTTGYRLLAVVWGIALGGIITVSYTHLQSQYTQLRTCFGKRNNSRTGPAFR